MNIDKNICPEFNVRCYGCGYKYIVLDYKNEDAALSPTEAIAVATSLGRKADVEWVDFVNIDGKPNGRGEYRPVWDVFGVKLGNNYHTTQIGIKETTIHLERTGLTQKKYKLHVRTTCFGLLDQYSVKLTRKQANTLRGVLYYWAGARMVGTRIHRNVTITKELNL